MPPPTSGGVTTLQILSMLSLQDLAKLRTDSLETIHLISEASKMAFADRNRYLADPDFINVPVGKLLDPGYLAKRATQINPATAMKRARPGKLAPESAYNCPGLIGKRPFHLARVYRGREWQRGFHDHDH